MTPNWLPLLQFSEGNPLTITGLVGQALHDELTTKEQVEKFVANLRTGEIDLTEDELKEGRSKSLHAALSYGFANAFNETEREQLALLYLFQGFVDEITFGWISEADEEKHLPALHHLTSEAITALLKRAADIGLLTDRGNGDFRIHPVLPWYFKGLFNQYYGTQATVAIYSFIRAMSRLAAIYSVFYQRGYHNKVFERLCDEEENLLYALHWARLNGYWREISGILQALNTTYNYTGRRLNWARLVNNILPEFVDIKTKKPLPGREKVWFFVTGYYARLKRDSRQWAESESWYSAQVQWLRSQTGFALVRPPKTLEPPAHHSPNPLKFLWNTISRLLFLKTELLDTEQCNYIDWLATALSSLGDVQRAQDKSSCVESYEQAIFLLKRLILNPSKADEHAQSRWMTSTALFATVSFDLGNAYLDIPKLYNLDKAEEWMRLSLEFLEEENALGRGIRLTQLGCVAYERFLKAQATNQPQEHLQKYFKEAEKHCRDALNIFPSDAIEQREVTSNQLGLIYMAAGNLKQALDEYNESIKCAVNRENPYGAALSCYNAARALTKADRFGDALEYAQASLHYYQRAKNIPPIEIQQTQELIANIQQNLKARGG